MRAFLGWLRGEKRHCSMAAIPTIEEEDERRPNRERGTLVGEQTRLINRIKAILARFGVRSFRLSLRQAADRLESIRTAEGTPLPDNTRAELHRFLERYKRAHHGVDGLGGNVGIERGVVELGVPEQPRVIMLTFYVIENQSAVERDRLLADAAGHSARDRRRYPSP